MELYLAHGIARRFFAAHGVIPAASLVGTFVTSLDMAGLSVTLALLDEEQFALWRAPVSVPCLCW